MYLPFRDTVSWVNPVSGPSRIQGQAWSVQVVATPGASTRFLGRMTGIQPGYYSMGAPLLITDRQRYEFRTDQSLWKGKFTLSGFARRDFDNLLPYKITRTTVTSAGVSLRLRPRKLPYFQLQFAPLYRENNRTDSLQLSDRISVISATSGYSFSFGGMTATTSFLYSQQISRSLSGKTDFSANMVNLSQVLTFSIPFSLNATGSYLHSQWSQDFHQTWTVDLSGSATFFQKWSNTFGGMLMQERGRTSRKSLYLNSSFPLLKNLNAEVLFQQDFFNPYTEDRPVFQQYFCQCGVMYRW
ncbi:MAG: hypothetical protein R3D00_18045 [Bacteroidia bacterium]